MLPTTHLHITNSLMAMNSHVAMIKYHMHYLAMSELKSKFVYHKNNLYFWKDHKMVIPTVPISMRLGENSKRHSLRNVMGLPFFLRYFSAIFRSLPFQKPL